MAETRCFVWGKGANQPTLLRSPASNVKKIAKGDTFILFITEDGELYCLGKSKYGCLGKGPDTRVTEPTLVTSSVKFLDVSVGDAHVIALSDRREVYTWGRNESKQLGAPRDPSEQSKPDKVPVPSAKRVYAYKDCSFVITTAGQVYSWGTNSDGLLGDPEHRVIEIPRQVRFHYDHSEVDKLVFAGDSVLAIKTSEEQFQHIQHIQHIQHVMEPQAQDPASPARSAKSSAAASVSAQSASQMRNKMEDNANFESLIECVQLADKYYNRLGEIHDEALKIKDEEGKEECSEDRKHLYKRMRASHHKHLRELFDDLYHVKQDYATDQRVFHKESRKELSPKLKRAKILLKNMLEDVFTLRSLNLATVRLMMWRRKMDMFCVFKCDKELLEEREPLNEERYKEFCLKSKGLQTRIRNKRNNFKRLSIMMDKLSFQTHFQNLDNVAYLCDLSVASARTFFEKQEIIRQRHQEEARKSQFERLFSLHEEVMLMSLDQAREDKGYDSTEFSKEGDYMEDRINYVKDRLNGALEALEDIKMGSDSLDDEGNKLIGLFAENIELRRFLLETHRSVMTKL